MTARLQSEAFDPGVLLADFCRGRFDIGAVVSFTGLVRGGAGLLALELEAYEGFTDVAIAEMAQQTAIRFDLQDVLVVHRIGRMAPGEPIVFVAAAARHRRSAFEAADQLMDFLKSRAPFWKKSHDGDGARWIEPTAQDYEDAARWSRSQQLLEETP